MTAPSLNHCNAANKTPKEHGKYTEETIFTIGQRFSIQNWQVILLSIFQVT